jgi:hypothetical protein
MALWDRGRGPELTYTDAVLQALRGEDGEIEGLAFFGMDVTEQVRSRSADGPGSLADSFESDLIDVGL